MSNADQALAAGLIAGAAAWFAMIIAFGSFGAVLGVGISTFVLILVAEAYEKMTKQDGPKLLKLTTSSQMSERAAERLIELLRKYGDARRRNLPASIAIKVRELVEAGEELVLAIDDGRHEHLGQEFVSTYLTTINDTLKSASSMYKDRMLAKEREIEISRLLIGTTEAIRDIRDEVKRGEEDRLQARIRFLEDRLKIDGRDREDERQTD